MSRPPNWLSQHAANVTSQFGEDGLIAKALEVIGENDRWCVEFGAWDGVHYSNTHALIRDRGYAAVLIEAQAARLERLRQTYADRPGVIALRALVGFGAEDGLDALLQPTPVPRNFDVLSVDIDGNDYHVWEAVTRYRPKLVVIEYNPTIPDEVDFVQPRDMRVCQGSSVRALQRLGREKRYELVAVTLTNALFADAAYFPRFEMEDNSLATLRTDRSKVTHLFNGYDGTVFVRGCGKLNWHRLAYEEKRMQLLPRWLRGYPENYPPWKRHAAAAYRWLRRRGVI